MSGDARVGQSRLAAVVRCFPDGVLVEDATRHLEVTNAAFCRLFALDLSPDAMVGADCAAAAVSVSERLLDPELFLARIDQIIAGGVPVAGDEITMKDGRTLQREYVPILADGVRNGHLWIYRDVSDRRRLEVELRAAVEAAGEAGRAKDGFIAMVSHELRTPLSAILGAAELLLANVHDAEQRRTLRTISQAGGTLLGLINDLLDWSKVRAGRFELREDPFDPARAIREACDPLSALSAERGLELEVRIGGLPSGVRGDAMRFRQVLTNLVANAVRFTQEGRVSVVASERAGRVRVEVTDTGEGVPEALRPHLFQAFAPGAGGRGGTGLGLSIARELVERMGGKIGYRPLPQGSLFWFELPFGAAPAPASAISGVFTPVLREGQAVLLVEDDEYNRHIASRMLSALGYTVSVANDGRLAIEAATSQSFAVVLMDVQMPNVDGLDATRRIREAGMLVPIVAMTANAMSGDRERCLAAGMDDFLAKPVTLKSLGAMLERWVGRESVAMLDDSLVEALGGPERAQPSLLREMAELFVVDAKRRHIALAEAAAAFRSDEVRKHAHALKGASASFGAQRVMLAALAIESSPAADGLEAIVRELGVQLEAVRLAAKARGWL